MSVTIGVIGGSGMYKLPGLENVESVKVSTPFGEPSGEYVIGTLKGQKIAFLARHGAGHTILPQDLNSRANIYGFKSLGVKWLISVSACGSLKEEYAPGDIVIPDGLFDRTSGRQGTFFGNGCVAHVSIADPFCKTLSKILFEAGKKTGKKTHMGGGLVTINGPRFSTRTESHIFRSWGLALVNMTTVPEAQLAAEAEISYAVMNHVTDYDCWKEHDEAVTVESVIKTLMGNVDAAKDAIVNAVEAISSGDLKSDSWNKLKDALVSKRICSRMLSYDLPGRERPDLTRLCPLRCSLFLLRSLRAQSLFRRRRVWTSRCSSISTGGLVREKRCRRRAIALK